MDRMIRMAIPRKYPGEKIYAKNAKLIGFLC